MDLVHALKFAFEDEEWPVKIAIGSLVTLIPVVGWIGGLGYQVSVARNVIRGSARPLPGSDGLGQVFIDGAIAGLAGLLYALPLALFWSVMALLGGLAGGSGEGDFALACLSVGAAVLSIVYGIPAVAMYWVGIMRYTQSGDFSEFTRFGALFREARAHLGTLATVFLYSLLLSLILAVISPLAVITCVGVFVLAFYSQIASGHLIGQAGREIIRY